jgi:hypothetical protein
MLEVPNVKPTIGQVTEQCNKVAALAELGKMFPDWRLGQTLANLALAAGHPESAAVWVLEDDEALAAARRAPPIRGQSPGGRRAGRSQIAPARPRGRGCVFGPRVLRMELARTEKQPPTPARIANL